MDVRDACLCDVSFCYCSRIDFGFEMLRMCDRTSEVVFDRFEFSISRSGFQWTIRVFFWLEPESKIITGFPSSVPMLSSSLEMSKFTLDVTAKYAIADVL